ncbi:MAG: hypothetical protein ABWZ77_01610 [Naasia sp.]
MRLPNLLDASDLPLTELSALRLDGEVFGLGDGFRPVDSPDDIRARALSLRRLLDGGRIAHRETAAWILGVLAAPPRPVPFCVHAGRSKGIDPLHGSILSEAILRAEEIRESDGVRWTSPLRTAVDLIRAPSLTPANAEAIRRLRDEQGIAFEAVIAHLADRRFQRERVRALRHLDAVDAA